MLVLAGVAFKIGAVPFQIWIPDVYQGAPTPVTAFLAVASKAAGFAVLLILTQRVFAPYQGLVIPVLSIMAAATIIFGNLAALTQHNVKRLIGLSGVSHAGYLMIGVIAAYREPHAIGAIWFYLFAYLLASFAVFGVMAHVAGPNDADQELDHYADLARDQPFLAAILAIGLGSLAGIPPLAGFMGKLLIFVAAFKAGLYPSACRRDRGRGGFDLLLFWLDQGRLLPRVAPGRCRPACRDGARADHGRTRLPDRADRPGREFRAAGLLPGRVRPVDPHALRSRL